MCLVAVLIDIELNYFKLIGAGFKQYVGLRHERYSIGRAGRREMPHAGAWAETFSALHCLSAGIKKVFRAKRYSCCLCRRNALTVECCSFFRK